MKKPLFQGVCTALVTPFLNGEVNYPMMEQLLRRQIDTGVRAVVLAGTTGEAPTLTDEEKEAYIWTDYGILNIGRYPNGEYVADLWYANWMGAVFVDENFQADSTTINASDRAAYSKTGIYVGCRGFDCDHIAWLHFYRHKDGNLARMEEMAVYINNKWKLPWYEDFPEFDGLDFNNAMVWHKDALYCFGVEYYDDANGKWCTRPIYLKLELIPIK